MDPQRCRHGQLRLVGLSIGQYNSHTRMTVGRWSGTVRLFESVDSHLVESKVSVGAASFVFDAIDRLENVRFLDILLEIELALDGRTTEQSNRSLLTDIDIAECYTY